MLEIDITGWANRSPREIKHQERKNNGIQIK